MAALFGGFAIVAAVTAAVSGLGVGLESGAGVGVVVGTAGFAVSSFAVCSDFAHPARNDAISSDGTSAVRTAYEVMSAKKVGGGKIKRSVILSKAQDDSAFFAPSRR